MSGQALSILRLSSLAQTMKAFMGRLMWGFPSGSFFVWRMILAPAILPDPFVSVSDAELSLSLRDAEEFGGLGRAPVDWGRYRWSGKGLSCPTRELW
uniref:Uncharacterized protein n=1 Tax=Ixodes ricinus TaxID=34613 RepID=A0A6B0UFQ7_IXORI